MRKRKESRGADIVVRLFVYVYMKPSRKRNLKINPGDYIGRAGGIARAKKLSPERRKQIAAEAARKRWEGHAKKKG